jgi:hypothetical protein
MADSTKGPNRTTWLWWFPPARWLTEYSAAWLPADLIAGITLAACAIPVSLAYATLAGLPPQVGIRRRRGQCDSITGTTWCDNTLRVAPPSTNSRSRE